MITSLGRTASPIAPCRVEWCRRALATSAHAESSSPSPIPPKHDRKTNSREGRVYTGGTPRRLFVRPWDGVPSMPDGFAMLRGIEKEYGKIKAFRFMRDCEIPSAYFSYFWVELQDPSRYPRDATTVLQVPTPEVERKRPGGIGIADLQPFLRPTPGTQEEAHEWTGVTERMVDEVDESKRATKVYDLRLEVSTKKFGRPWNDPISKRMQLQLAEAFVKWGGFASPPVQEAKTPGENARPTFDRIMAKVPEQPSTAPKDESPPSPVEEEPHKPFIHEFDEPTRPVETRTSAPPETDKVSTKKSPSLLTMQREGTRLSRKQKALLQAAAISRTPLPSPEEKQKVADEKAAAEREAEEEEKKRIHNKVWELVKSKWF